MCTLKQVLSLRFRKKWLFNSSRTRTTLTRDRFLLHTGCHLPQSQQLILIVGISQNEEVTAAIKRSKARSAPSPLDGVSYTVFKKCPALVVALHDLFNACWVQSSVPDQWKMASVKLIGKPAASDDPTSLSNFRPIALTPCVGILFTTILCKIWLSFMLYNKYLDRRIQKAFVPKISGCTEHHLKLATVLNDARIKHKSLAVCWLDLANAYGSVQHSLIAFSLRHYHAPGNSSGFLLQLISDHHFSYVVHSTISTGNRGVPGRSFLCHDIQYSHQHHGGYHHNQTGPWISPH